MYHNFFNSKKVVALLVIDSKSTNQQSTQSKSKVLLQWLLFADCLAVTTSS
jgi:hypothetical protein